jgi:chromosomal replication initiation ATPase DnaA
MSKVDFQTREHEWEKFRGMNPAFVRRIWADRKRAEAEAKAAAEEAEQRRRAAERDRMIREATESSRIREMEQQAEKRFASLIKQLDSGRPEPVARIIRRVADAHGIRPAEITGASRNASIAAARHEAIWLVSKNRPDLTHGGIGWHFGKRDASTIWHSLQKYAARIEGNQ